MSPGSKLLAVVAALVIVLVIGESLRRRQMRGRFGIVWLGVAVLAALAAVFDGALLWLTQALGLRLPINLILFVGLIFLLVVSIQLSYEIGRLEENNRSMAEQVALLRAKVDDAWAAANGAPRLDTQAKTPEPGRREPVGSPAETGGSPSAPGGPAQPPVEREDRVQ